MKNISLIMTLLFLTLNIFGQVKIINGPSNNAASVSLTGNDLVVKYDGL
jgi:hypothetical protein